MRGWAALMVVIHHGAIALDFALYTGRPAESRGRWDLAIAGTPFFPFASAGSLAVCIFFALSGFVLTHAYLRSRQSWPALAIRRYVRLGVPMLVGCLLAWLLLSFGLMRPQPAALITHSSWLGEQFQQRPDLLVAASEPIRLLLGFPSVFAREYDSSLWTMPVEAVGSLVLMTAFAVLRRVRGPTERLAGYGFGLLAVLYAGSLLSQFAFGAALRLLQPSKLLAAVAGSRWALALMLTLAAFFGTVPFSRNRWMVYDLMTAFSRRITWHTWPWAHSAESFWHGIGAALIVLAVAASPAMQSALSRPLGRFLGRISFPLYVVHIPLLMVVECDAIIVLQRTGLPASISGLLSLLTFLVLAVTVAAVLTPLIEGGAIGLSARCGDVVEAGVQRLAIQLRRVFGRQPERANQVAVPPPR